MEKYFRMGEGLSRGDFGKRMGLGGQGEDSEEGEEEEGGENLFFSMVKELFLGCVELEKERGELVLKGHSEDIIKYMERVYHEK